MCHIAVPLTVRMKGQFGAAAAAAAVELKANVVFD
jgi:hypothetical protein